MKLKTICLEFFTDNYEHSYENIVKKIRKRLCELPQEDEEKILMYLKSAPATSMVLSEPYDFFTNEGINYELTCMHTDGTYCWPGLLFYYVEKYHYQVDVEFVEHMRKNNWKVLKLSVEELKRS